MFHKVIGLSVDKYILRIIITLKPFDSKEGRKTEGTFIHVSLKAQNRNSHAGVMCLNSVTLTGRTD